jgi:hypothetical protein
MQNDDDKTEPLELPATENSGEPFIICFECGTRLAAGIDNGICSQCLEQISQILTDKLTV